MAEVITVVGGGVIGLTTAFELTERGQRVRVYDPTPGERGTGASYFAGGMLAPIAEVQFQQDALFPLMTASANAYPSLMRRLAAVTDAPTATIRPARWWWRVTVRMRRICAMFLTITIRSTAVPRRFP